LALRLDGRYARWGLNLAATWRSGARLRRDLGQDGPDDLLLSPLTLIGFTLSTVLSSPRSEASDTGPRRRTQGLRLELGVENLFDARPTATLGDGRPAPAYGRDDQDPLGRVIRLSLSRRF
jgi:outer membrane receptor protein involved in Fe transport